MKPAKRRKLLVLTLSPLVLLPIVLWVVGGCVGPAPADPSALDYPPYEPVVNGRLVTIEVISINGQEAPGNSLEKAVETFSKYVAGDVRVVQGAAVTIEPDSDGAISTSQLKPVIAKRNHRGPSTIAILLIPALSPRDEPGGVCRHEPDGGHVVITNGKNVSRRMPLSREHRWEQLIRHELCHALKLPYGRSHACSKTRHCTYPDCVLYGGGATRFVLTAIYRLKLPMDLCEACKGEIRQAQQAANGTLIDPDAPHDPMEWADQLVKLNPDHPLAYVRRSGRFWYQERHEECIEDLTKAIELGATGDMLRRCHQNRSAACYELGQFRRAAEDLERVVQLDPSNAVALNILAWLRATCRDGEIRDGARAVRLASRACELTEWKKMRMLDTLAAAYAETGQFDQAIEYQNKAISLADGTSKEWLRPRFDLYQAGKPYHSGDD